MRDPEARPDALTARVVRPGAITEVVGRLSSGRTSVLMACLRDLTLAAAVVALVDTDHAFDPGSARRAGLDLRRLLWVRCGGRRDVALRATDLLVRCPGFALIGLDVGESPPRLPLTAAFRLKLAVRRSGAALLVVGARRITGAGASLALESAREALAWSGPGPTPTRLVSMRSRLSVLRGLGDGLAMEWTA
jgi:recombination protein RecA